MINDLFIGIIIGIILLYSLIEIKNKCFIKDDTTEFLYKKIRIFVKESSGWALAATQDKTPIIATLHANYGAGYLWALKHLATGEQIKNATGIDILEFEKEITKVQDETTMKLAKLCPKYAPNKTKSYLSKIAKEG